MAEVDRDSRTEEATPRRREEARQEGRIAFSSELLIGVVLLCAALLLRSYGQGMMESLLVTFRGGLQVARFRDLSVASATQSLQWSVTGIAFAILPISIAAWGMTIVVGLMQTRGAVSGKAFTLKWERLSPQQGFARIFSKDALIKLLIATLKLLVSLAIVYWLVSSQLRAIAFCGFGSLRQTAAVVGSVAGQTLLYLGLWSLVVGCADYGVQWWKHEQSLKMTKSEVKQEARDDQGDPQIRSRIRQMRRDMRKQRGIKNVPTATVVITNPTHFAVAMKYEPGMTAPKVVAKGTDATAKRIKQIARKSGVSIVEDKPLARALYRHVEVGSEVPAQFYQAIAAVLVSVLRARGQTSTDGNA